MDAAGYKSLAAKREAIEHLFQIEIDRLTKSRLVVPAYLHHEQVDFFLPRPHSLPTPIENDRAGRR